MNQEEILEYNKRCAEFLEYEFDELSETYETSHLKLVEPQAFGDEQFSCKLKIYELDFHSDWNWIMEVKSKICQNKEVDEFNTHYDSVAKGFYCSILPSYKNKFDSFYTKVLTNEKEAVVQVINQFLIWYEENKS